MSLDDPQGDKVSEEQLWAVVESIGGHARSVNQERAARLGQALADIAAGSREESRRREATEIAHQIVGSAGTFGFSGASLLASEIERYVVAADFSDQERLADARDQVRRLHEELADGPDYQPDEERDPTS